ncbi:MAG: hypothetical protein IPL46_35100 [Saprospiraceae bacterium]|nr:hypothetical protein [Saprospiraceae bacterium]
MNPLSQLTNLAINDIVGSSADGQNVSDHDLQHDSKSFQLIILDEALGEGVKSMLSGFEFSFKKVHLKGISVLKKGSSFSDIIPILKSNLDDQIHTVVIGGQSSTLRLVLIHFSFAKNSLILLSSSHRPVKT